MSLSSGAEIPQILHALDQGTVMIKFFKRGKRPEKRIFCLKTDTFEILQFPMVGKLPQCEETSEQEWGGGRCRGRGEMYEALSVAMVMMERGVELLHVSCCVG